MRWLTIINGLGLIAAPAYIGISVEPGHMPWGGIAATMLFLVSLAVPMVREYRSLGRGFRRMEATHMDSVRRDHFPEPGGEILTDGQPPPVLRKRPSRFAGVAVLTAAGVILLGMDAVIWLTR